MHACCNSLIMYGNMRSTMYTRLWYCQWCTRTRLASTLADQSLYIYIYIMDITCNSIFVFVVVMGKVCWASAVTTDGTRVNIPFISPLALLYVAYNQADGFKALMQNTLIENWSSQAAPWKLVLYSDEVVPGNHLGVHVARKVWVIYYSFMEFGCSRI